MTKFKLENVELFHRSMELMKTDDFKSFRALVDQLEQDDREEVLQMYKKAYHYLKTGNPTMPSLESWILFPVERIKTLKPSSLLA